MTDVVGIEVKKITKIIFIFRFLQQIFVFQAQAVAGGLFFFSYFKLNVFVSQVKIYFKSLNLSCVSQLLVLSVVCLSQADDFHPI